MSADSRQAVTDALGLADRHDAAGRHEDAVNALARASAQGDLEATTALGKRLIIGDRAPYMPKDGAKLLSDAARAGNVDASLRLACMTALGAHVPQSWEGALGLLVHAATLGSKSARGQLRVLAGGDAASETDEDWADLARSIDLAAWLAPVPGETLHEGPLVRYFPKFLNDAACVWIRDHMRDYLKPAQIYSGDKLRHVQDEMRTNSVGAMHLACIDVVNVVVQYRISAVCGMPVDNFDGPTALHYDIGEEIKDHCDYIHPKIPNYEQELATHGERLITFLLYLNGDFEGGETAFPLMGLSHKGIGGDGIFFVNVKQDGTPDGRSLHAGRPPTGGEKWLLSQFVRARPVYNTPAETLY